MIRTPVESSNVKSVGYDENTQTLEIEYHKKGKSTGVYQYMFVEAGDFAALISSDNADRNGLTVGEYTNKHVKQHPWKKVS